MGNITTTCEFDEEWENSVFSITEFLELFLICTGVVLNGAVLYTVVRYKRHRSTAYNYFIINLILSDILCCFYMMSHWLLHYVVQNENYHNCSILSTIMITWLGTTFATLILITIERLLAVCAADLRDRIVNRRNTLLVITVTWLYSAIVGTASFWEHREDQDITHCEEYKFSSKAIKIFLVINGFIGIAIMLTAYFIIFFVARKELKEQQQKVATFRRFNATQLDLSTLGPKTQRFFVVTMSNFVLASPMLVVFLIDTIVSNFSCDDKRYRMYMAKIVTYFLCELIIVINPFVFLFKNPDLRSRHEEDEESEIEIEVLPRRMRY